MIQNNTFYMSGAIGSTSEYKDIRLPHRIIEDIKNGKYKRITKGSPVIYKGATALTFYLGSAVDITEDMIKY